MAEAEQLVVEWIAEGDREARQRARTELILDSIVEADNRGEDTDYEPDWNEVSDRVAAMRERFIDSPHRCRLCSKRMTQETTGSRSADGQFNAYTRHFCLGCEEA